MWFAFNGRATRSFLALLCMMEFILFIDRVNLAAAAPGGAADITLIDDPLKAEEALSDARRQAACSACTKTIGRSCARAGTMGGGALSGDRRSGRGATRSTRSGNREPSPAERARPCIASASRSTLSTASTARSGNTTSAINISRPCAPGRRNGQSRMGHW
jgi:hypothetical protein